MQIFEERATTAIYVRVKRFTETHFILVDEYETVDALKGRLLNTLETIGFKLDPRAEEPMTIEDIRLFNRRRVSVQLSHVTSIVNVVIGWRCNMSRLASIQQHRAMAYI